MNQQHYPIWSVPNDLRVAYQWLFGVLFAVALVFVIKEQLVYIQNTHDFPNEETIPDGYFQDEEWLRWIRASRFILDISASGVGSAIVSLVLVHITSGLFYLCQVLRQVPCHRARMLSARRMASPIEERPVFGSTLADLHDLRLERYFRDRFPDWSRPDDCAHTLVTHKLAATTDAGVIPTHLGILLFTADRSRDPSPSRSRRFSPISGLPR